MNIPLMRKRNIIVSVTAKLARYLDLRDLFIVQPVESVSSNMITTVRGLELASVTEI